MNIAVILAAGIGRRIKNLFQIPKGFIKIGDKSLIDRSIKILKNSGINKIYIGTGHHSELYEELANEESIFCVKNNKFKNSGSFYTLFKFQNILKEDFLLLESDIFFERKAVEMIIKCNHENIILTTELSGSGDEVFVEKDKNKLKKMSKDQLKLSNVFGEFVGISKISNSLFKNLCNWGMKNPNQMKDMHYEQVISEISHKSDITILNIKNLIWSEIDNEEDYFRVVKEIGPRILDCKND
tara:strand:+ start:301 stop:1023 length:723 start_codon:yes stop_codon:yes gene_type:complete